MRISGGSARGIRLRVPRGSRPASERVRQAVFSSLAERVVDATVADLYCGSGAYGLEALSRGAHRAFLVDRSTQAVDAARANARAASLHERAVVRRSDVHRYLSGRPSTAFDLVFCDPPYGEGAEVSGVLARLGPWMAEDGTLVVEASSAGDVPEDVEGWVLEADRRYGDTRVLVFRHTPRRA